MAKYCDTTYYFFETENLPLYGPLRSFGVPESLIDIVEPLSTFVVELGYRRDIPPYVPSPARLIPVHDPAKVADDFFAAVDETIDNTLAVLGSPPALSIPAPSARAAGDSLPEPTVQDSKTLTGTDVTNEGVAGATAPDNGSPGQGATPQTRREESVDTHPLRSMLRGPIGMFGPRVRDLLHRGHGASADKSPPVDGASTHEAPTDASADQSGSS